MVATVTFYKYDDMVITDDNGKVNIFSLTDNIDILEDALEEVAPEHLENIRNYLYKELDETQGEEAEYNAFLRLYSEHSRTFAEELGRCLRYRGRRPYLNKILKTLITYYSNIIGYYFQNKIFITQLFYQHEDFLNLCQFTKRQNLKHTCIFSICRVILIIKKQVKKDKLKC